MMAPTNGVAILSPQSTSNSLSTFSLLVQSDGDRKCEMLQAPVERLQTFDSTMRFLRTIYNFEILEYEEPIGWSHVDSPEAHAIFVQALQKNPHGGLRIRLSMNEDSDDEMDESPLENQHSLKMDEIEYMDEEIAGNGAFGTIRRCWHRGRGVHLAVKKIHYRVEESNTIQAEIENLCTCSRVEAPSNYIVVYHGMDFDGNREVEIFLEWMDKLSIEKYSPIELTILPFVSRCIFEGLKEMWKHNILHRDLKPSNILVNSQGYVKLGDFGLSKRLEKSSCDTYIGTEIYMAPERLNGFTQYGREAEIWSYGVCLWELLKGNYPIVSRNVYFIQDAIKTGIGKFAPADIEYAPLQELVIGCVENDLSKRWKKEEIENCEFHKNTIPIRRDLIREFILSKDC